MCNCDNYKNTGEVIDQDSSGGNQQAVEVGSYIELTSKTGNVGDLFFGLNSIGTEKLWVYTGNTWQVMGETIEMIAQEDLNIGELVEMGTIDNNVIRTNSAGDVGFVGVVCVKNVSAGERCSIAINGVWFVGVLAKGTPYDVGNYLRPSSTAGLAQETSSVADEPFAKIAETTTVSVNGNVVKAVLHTQEIY
jgi:predicted RecA/RadA family phage recombinase